MTAPITAVPARPIQNIEQTFPKLTSAQIARITTHGRKRRVEKGEVLIAVGNTIPLFFVVVEGTIEVIQPAGRAESTVMVLTPGDFSGEVSILAGRRSGDLQIAKH